MEKLNELYLFIIIFEDGREKVMLLWQNEKILPVIVGNRAEVEMMRPYAEKIVTDANAAGPMKMWYVVRHYRASRIPVDNPCV